MTRLTDGSRTVDIEMYEADFPDYSSDFFACPGIERNVYGAYVVDDVDYCIGQAMDWQNATGDFSSDLDAYPEDERPDRLVIVTEAETIHDVQFEAGQGRHVSGGVNYLICPDIPDLYAEVPVPEGASEDYGYLTLKSMILKQAQELGIRSDSLRFWYDGQEQFLADDATVD